MIKDSIDERIAKFTDFDQNLDIFVEECAEAIQEAMKINRFGINGVHPADNRTNALRFATEVVDLVTVLMILVENSPELKAIWDDMGVMDKMATDKLDKLEKNYVR
jgi:predicted urease superfamily metal-dependent hydrolase